MSDICEIHKQHEDWQIGWSCARGGGRARDANTGAYDDFAFCRTSENNGPSCSEIVAKNNPRKIKYVQLKKFLSVREAGRLGAIQTNKKYPHKKKLWGSLGGNKRAENRKKRMGAVEKSE